jgi:hypothetical protein
MSAMRQACCVLIAAGFGVALSVAAAPAGSLFGATPDQELLLLVQLATYIGNTDPLTIGAAWRLEQAGHDRSQINRFGDDQR